MGVKSTGSHPNTTKADGHLLEYFRQNFGVGGGAALPIPPSGMTATGGVISDYTDPGSGTVYRSHVFTSSGTFTVSKAAVDIPNNVEYLVVAGGGGGGGNVGGGGGAGGYRTNVSGSPGDHTTSVAFPVTVQSYSVTVGGGGVAGKNTESGPDGNDSSFGPITALKGGGGGARTPGSQPQNAGRAGGSGGGGCGGESGATVTGGSSTAVSTPSPWPGPATQGKAGGAGANDPQPAAGGGGGGAGGAGTAGQTGPPGYGGNGGDGLPNVIAYGPTNAVTYAAGGGGGVHPPAPGSAGGSGGTGGGGAGADSSEDGNNATFATGSGGGGGSNGRVGGNGGSGIVVVRYEIGSVSTAKATGGAISFYGGKTIHTFLNSGTFAVTNGPLSIEYLALGGGGGGGDSQGGCGGGGGAGGFVTGPETANDSTSYTVTIGAGGRGGSPPSPAFLNGAKGDDTTISGTGISVTARGGGGGGRGDADSYPDFASGGGAGSAGGAGRAAGPGGGYAGGPSSPSNDGFAGGGGGGAGGAGVAGLNPPPGANTAVAGPGGLGRQLPSTFRNPDSSIGFPGPTGPVPGTNPGGDTSGLFWVSGGGGGGVGEYQPAPQTDLVNGKGGGPGAPDDGWAGAGNGGEAYPPYATYPDKGTAAKANSGAGGGGGGYPGEVPNRYWGSAGGSGLVLIAYPT